MLGGYVRYPGVARMWNAMRRVPARHSLAWALETMPLPVVEFALGALGPLARIYASRGELGPSIRRAAGWLRSNSRAELFEATMTVWSDPGILLGPSGAQTSLWRPQSPSFDNGYEPMFWRDAVDYLPGDILTKVDRAAMANSLETRVPFLDPDLAALAWRIPPSMKICGETTKWITRQVLARYVPAALTERPKVGFTVPLHEWLTGGLRSWALNLLDPDVIRRQGVLDPGAVERAWQGLQRGDSALSGRVWAVLMFQAWLAERGR
jgi:asparagine synthase (glutamine-hydrolysing)